MTLFIIARIHISRKPPERYSNSITKDRSSDFTFHITLHLTLHRTFYYYYSVGSLGTIKPQTIRSGLLPQCDIVCHNCSLTATEITDSRAMKDSHLSFCRPQKAWHNIGPVDSRAPKLPKALHYVVPSSVNMLTHTHTQTRVHRSFSLSEKFHHRPCQRQLEYYRASSTTSGNSVNRRGKKPLRKMSITLRHR